METMNTIASREPQTGAAGMPAHAHHWLIEEATGPKSHGVCRDCHAEREFRNWLAEADFVTRGERLYAA